jgi:zinc transport system substrate-binding protein
LPLAAQAKVNIVTSILPLQQITAAIMQGAGEPELLIKNQHSAHHFAFKPSHFRTLKSADLVIWIDRHFESGFQRIPEILQQSTTSLELLRALDLKNQDGHIWYSPKLLRNIIEQISASLIAIDPAHTELYKANTQTLQQAIVDWAQFTRNQIASAKPQYLLDHDFLVHFQADFQLKALATIHDSHDQHGGIQAMQLIEKQLGESAAKCLLTNEPDVSKIGQNLADKFSLSVYHIGVADSFVDHLYHLTETLAKCR